MRLPARWVLWDVKDTLLQVRRSVGEQYCKEAVLAGLNLPAARVENAFRQNYRQQSRILPNYGRSQGMNSKIWWIRLVKDTFAQCGVDDPVLLDRLGNNLYHNFCGPENWEVFPDSDRTLKSCTALGLKQEDAGVAKPDPSIFTQALALCGVPASSVVHVGDHYVNDYLTSRALGIQGYLLDRQDSQGHLDIPPQHRLQNLDELPARLQQTVLPIPARFVVAANLWCAVVGCKYKQKSTFDLVDNIPLIGSLSGVLKTKLALSAQPVDYEGLCCNPIINLNGIGKLKSKTWQVEENIA
ncbi:hypothetical protein DNTS_020729, partial [Danionella cerebrum]